MQPNDLSYLQTLDEVKRDYIREVYRLTRNNASETARILKISSLTVTKYLKEQNHVE